MTGISPVSYQLQANPYQNQRKATSPQEPTPQPVAFAGEEQESQKSGFSWGKAATVVGSILLAGSLIKTGKGTGEGCIAYLKTVVKNLNPVRWIKKNPAELVKSAKEEYVAAAKAARENPEDAALQKDKLEKFIKYIETRQAVNPEGIPVKTLEKAKARLDEINATAAGDAAKATENVATQTVEQASRTA